MFNLAIRNLKTYYRQPGSVFFSLMSVLISVGLYFLFLGDVWTRGFPPMVAQPKPLMGRWLVAGILSVSSLTTTLGAFGTMISDQERKITKDFLASPLKRSTLMGGYIISAFLVSIFMSIMILILGELYLLSIGGHLLSFKSLVEVFCVMLLSSFASSCFVFFIVGLIKSLNAFATASTVIGTLVGFLAGLYIPIGDLPSSVQWLTKVFPFSHTGALLRQIMMKDALALSFAGIPAPFIEQFKSNLGIVLHYGDYTASVGFHILALIALGLLCFVLALWNISRKES